MPANASGSVTTEFDFGLPTDASRIVHTNTVIRTSLSQPVTHEHTLGISGTEFVNDLLRLALSTSTPRVRFRMGIKFADRCQWLPWQNHIIVSHATIPESRGAGTGYVLRITTADQLYAMDRASKVVARKGRISAIVEEIARENGLESVVEPTSIEGVYLQSFQSDTNFIRSRLLPRAFSRKNAAQYLFFIRDNVLHFHPPDHHAVLHALEYHASSAFRLVAAEHAQQLFSDGGAGMRLIVHDPYTGENREIVSDPNLTLRCAEALYPTWELPNGERNEFYHLSQNEPAEVVAIAQNVYDAARASSNHLELTFTSFMDMQVGDFLELIHSQSDQPSPFGGLYQVVGVVHQIQQSALVSTYTVQRGETIRLRIDTLIQGKDNQSRYNLQAPGRDLNRKELQASRSSGGGDETSVTLFREVTDASRMPT